MSTAFGLRGVRRSFDGFKLDIEDLSLEQGYVMGLIGRNGAGKSTTIKILMNLVYPDEGDVRVLGMSQPERELEIKRQVGYVSEEPAFYGDMTAGWMARLVGRYYPAWDNALYHEYLRKFALDDRKKVKDLSRGMKLKLGLTLALSHRPKLLILDEPTSGIDPVARRELLKEVVEVIKDEERTVLFSSHITSDIEQVADHVAIIDQGRIVESSDRETMLAKWRKVTGTLSAEHRDGAGAIASMFSSLRFDGVTFAGITGSFSNGWLEALKTKGTTNLQVMGVGLDEMLVSLTGKGE